MSDGSQLTSHQVAGYKAAMKNPNVSKEAKQHAGQVVQEAEGVSQVHRSAPVHYDDGKEESRVTGGYKATLHNPNTSQEAKEHAREVLEEKGVL